MEATAPTSSGIGIGAGWRLRPAKNRPTSIINAFAQQLEARVDVLSGAEGTTVSVTVLLLQSCKSEPRPGGLPRLSIRSHARLRLFPVR